MYIAGYIVAGFLVAGAYAVGRLRGRWGRYERTALAIPLTIAALAAPVQVLVGDWAAARSPHEQPTKLAAFEGLRAARRAGAPVHLLGWYTDGQVKYGIAIPKLLSLLAFHDPERDGAGPRRGAGRTTARRSTSSGSPSRRWSGSARCSRCSASPTCVVRIRRRRLPESRWFYRALVARRAAVGRRPDLRLGHDRGRPPAVGRLPASCAPPRPSPAPAASPSATRRSRSSTSASRVGGRLDPAPPRPRPARAALDASDDAARRLTDAPLRRSRSSSP